MKKSKGILCYVSFFYLAVMISGCASYKITDKNGNEGYPVYTPEPYLMITSGDSTIKGEIVWLPNYNKEYRITTSNFLAKADFEFEITNGWMLTTIHDKGDNTNVASELLDSIQKNTEEKIILDQSKKSVNLYRLNYDKNGYIKIIELVPRNEIVSPSEQ